MWEQNGDGMEQIPGVVHCSLQVSHQLDQCIYQFFECFSLSRSCLLPNAAHTTLPIYLDVPYINHMECYILGVHGH